MYKRIFSAFLAILLALSLLAGSGCGLPDQTTVKETVPSEPVKPDKELSLTAVGDVMLARHVGYLIKQNGEDYPFKLIGRLLQKSDITFGNLESPLSDRGRAMPGKGICFRGQPKMANVLANYGFNIMSVANNHALDYDAPAFLDTIKLLNAQGIRTVGGGNNIMEARKPVIFEKNNLKVGFLAYTVFADTVFGTKYRRPFRATETESGVAPLVREAILEDVYQLDPTVDVTVVSLHWGVEYSKVPEQTQQQLARELIDNGADLIIGHHPHIIQGFERYKKGLIAYSLGNFIFDQNIYKYTQQGLMLDATLKPHEIQNITITPVYIKLSQPLVMRGPDAEALLKDVSRLTGDLGTRTEIRNDQIVIE
ncbi:MAG: CapA family protein [Candidatus Saccharibacteria bacterium]